MHGTADTKELTSVYQQGHMSLADVRRELKPHRLVAATAYKNRMFLIAIQANGRQWRKAESDLRHVQESFDIVQA